MSDPLIDFDKFQNLRWAFDTEKGKAGLLTYRKEGDQYTAYMKVYFNEKTGTGPSAAQPIDGPGDFVEIVKVSIQAVILITELLPYIEKLILQIRAMFGSEKARKRLEDFTRAERAIAAARRVYEAAQVDV
jgi:hypothetical protein